MNKVIIMGRLTKDPEIKYTQANMAIARFTVAVDRKGKDNNEADFINCVAFDKKAEFLEKYWSKGMKMLLTGRIQTGSYEKDGHKVFTTEVIADDVEFTESKSENNVKQETPEFRPLPPDIDDDLPFAQPTRG